MPPLKVEFQDEDWDRLEIDPQFTAGMADNIVRAFRKVMQIIRAAQDERDLYALRGLRFKKLNGDRAHQHSIRLNDQWRLIVELRGSGEDKVFHIVGIEDYH
jgi:proteic killer suppression protein